MYWTHLIFAFLNGALLTWQRIEASKPGYLDFDNLPETNFSCDGKVIGGYYADVETGCQMFHVCTIGQKGEVTDIKFLCLNGTVFDQETRVCERIDEVDCSKSEDFFGLNLELYGNNANFGIQPENEFECEDCSTDQTEDDEYEESEETTTYTTSTTTTTTTTTTTPKPTTTSTTTARPTHQYQTSNQETIAALLALHNAFNQGLQGSKIKAPPPRVINNAFSPTKPTAKPYSTYATQRSNVNLNFKSHYTPDSQSYGSLNLQQRERPYYFTPTTEKSNYHHFHSGDTSFGHSFDVTRPYNFQYFHSRKIPENKPSISVVTSTSTSTSVKTSKPNATEYPTGYDDYQDDIQDSFFDDVPKLRQKRDNHPNHKYEEGEITTIRYKNHKYDDDSKKNSDKEREEFLQNLLGSIDLEDSVREKMSEFFKKEEEEMNNMTKSGGFMMNVKEKIGQIFLPEMNITDSDERKTRTDRLLEWRKHFDDMKKDISLNYTFDLSLGGGDNNKLNREKRDTRRSRTTTPSHLEERSHARKPSIDTEKFQFDNRRTRPGRERIELKPVSEDLHDDITTLEYRKTSKRGRSQPRSTTSLRDFKFNYETTSALPESFATQARQIRRRPLPSKEARDFVHEENDHPITTLRYHAQEFKTKQLRTSTVNPLLAKESRSLINEEPESTTPLHPEYKHFDSEQEVPKRHHTSQPTTKQEDDFIHEERIITDSHQHNSREHSSNQERTLVSNPLSSKGGRSQSNGRSTTVPTTRPKGRSRGRVRARPEPAIPTTSSTTVIPRVALTPDPNFDCEGKVKGGFYADTYNDCRAFFICSQGEINGPLLKTHFPCGDKTKFNQRSRTCQAEDLVECEISKRYFHLNNDFLVPESEDSLKGSFEPMKVR